MRKTFIRPLLLVLLRIKASVHLVPMLMMSKTGIYFLRSRKMEVTAPLPVVLLLSMTKIQHWTQRRGSVWLQYSL